MYETQENRRIDVQMKFINCRYTNMCRMFTVDSFATNCRFMKKERKRWETKGWIEERRRKTDELERRGWDEEGESSEIIQCEQQRIEPETESQWLELRGDKMVRA